MVLVILHVSHVESLVKTVNTVCVCARRLAFVFRSDFLLGVDSAVVWRKEGLGREDLVLPSFISESSRKRLQPVRQRVASCVRVRKGRSLFVHCDDGYVVVRSTLDGHPVFCHSPAFRAREVPLNQFYTEEETVASSFAWTSPFGVMMTCVCVPFSFLLFESERFSAHRVKRSSAVHGCLHDCFPVSVVVKCYISPACRTFEGGRTSIEESRVCLVDLLVQFPNSHKRFLFDLLSQVRTVLSLGERENVGMSFIFRLGSSQLLSGFVSNQSNFLVLVGYSEPLDIVYGCSLENQLLMVKGSSTHWEVGTNEP